MENSPPYNESHIALLVAVGRKTLGRSAAPAADTEEWLPTLAAAADHDFTGILASYLSTCPAIPAEVMAKVDTVFLCRAARTLKLYAALAEILARFRAVGLDAIVWKGPALSKLVWSGIAMRECGDLDLIVRPGDLRKSTALLAELGWHPTSTNHPKLRGEKDIEFVREEDGLAVELHWAASPASLRFSSDSGIWERAQTLSLEGIPMQTLGWDDTIYCLCVHGARHGWSRLKWVMDLALILRIHGLAVNWDALLERSRRGGSSRVVLAGIRLACAIFDLAEPAAIANYKSNDQVVTRVVREVRASLLRKRRMTRPELLAMQIALHERVLDRLFVIATASVPDLPQLLPSTAKPLTSGPLRFLSRPLRLFNLYGFTWLRTAITGR